jgi:hypothetical protein
MHSVAPYGAAGFGAQTAPDPQFPATTAVVDEQACAYVAQAGGALELEGCGVQPAGSTTGADAEMADVNGVPQPLVSLRVVQAPAGRVLVEQADAGHTPAACT